MQRLLDLILTLAAAPLLALPTLLVAIATLIRDGRPVLFSQVRIGYQERQFRLYKFRSMSNAKNAKGELLPDASRLTLWGKFLRASSLDELPQLWNVLRGDMSLVGPRPLLVQYLPRYSQEQRRRHLVRPGITGWAQVKGRNTISWKQKFDLDIWYVDHQSIGLYMKILWLTAIKVLKRDGISQGGHATMSEFMGND